MVIAPAAIIAALARCFEMFMVASVLVVDEELPQPY
jgi:hypothetical protein